MVLAAEYQQTLKKVPLFMSLDEKDFNHILTGTTVSTLSSGDTLFTQHQPAKEFFYIIKGKIKISLLSIDGAEKVVDIINEGNTFAEAIILRGMDGYPVNSEALGEVIILKINADNYTHVLKHSTEACIKVISCLSTRTHWLMNEMERLSLHNASYRLISFLLENCDTESEEPVEITLSAPKHVIASRLSITPETLSRTLKALSKEDLLHVHEKHIILNNPTTLKKMISL